MAKQLVTSVAPEQTSNEEPSQSSSWYIWLAVGLALCCCVTGACVVWRRKTTSESIVFNEHIVFNDTAVAAETPSTVVAETPLGTYDGVLTSPSTDAGAKYDGVLTSPHVERGNVAPAADDAGYAAFIRTVQGASGSPSEPSDGMSEVSRDMSPPSCSPATDKNETQRNGGKRGNQHQMTLGRKDTGGMIRNPMVANSSYRHTVYGDDDEGAPGLSPAPQTNSESAQDATEVGSVATVAARHNKPLPNDEARSNAEALAPSATAPNDAAPAGVAITAEPSYQNILHNHAGSSATVAEALSPGTKPNDAAPTGGAITAELPYQNALHNHAGSSATVAEAPAPSVDQLPPLPAKSTPAVARVGAAQETSTRTVEPSAQNHPSYEVAANQPEMYAASFEAGANQVSQQPAPVCGVVVHCGHTS